MCVTVEALFRGTTVQWNSRALFSLNTYRKRCSLFTGYCRNFNWENRAGQKVVRICNVASDSLTRSNPPKSQIKCVSTGYGHILGLNQQSHWFQTQARDLRKTRFGLDGRAIKVVSQRDLKQGCTSTFSQSDQSSVGPPHQANIGGLITTAVARRTVWSYMDNSLHLNEYNKAHGFYSASTWTWHPLWTSLRGFYYKYNKDCLTWETRKIHHSNIFMGWWR